MKRNNQQYQTEQKFSENRLPDAIPAVPVDEQYTQIPNFLLRTTKLSLKAKALLAILLSNSKGWITFMIQLRKVCKEGESAIQSTIRELEESGYLLRVAYRDPTTKRMQGSFWAYTHTPELFDLQEHDRLAVSIGMELCRHPASKSSYAGTRLHDPNMENPVMENPGLRTLKNKNPNKEDNSMAKSMTTRPSRKGPSVRHEQLARLLQAAIERRKKINKTVNMKSWPLQIQKLCNSLDDPRAPARVRRAIKFLDRSYAEYGMQSEQEFIPTVESVRGFLEKFGKVENAMAREEQSGQRIITRRGGETVLKGGEPGLDKKWFPVEDQKIDGKSVRVWENGDGDRVACNTYPQPDPDGPIKGTLVVD